MAATDCMYHCNGSNQAKIIRMAPTINSALMISSAGQPRCTRQATKIHTRPAAPNSQNSVSERRGSMEVRQESSKTAPKTSHGHSTEAGKGRFSNKATTPSVNNRR